jgi:cellulose synthase (UDP-forming)
MSRYADCSGEADLLQRRSRRSRRTDGNRRCVHSDLRRASDVLERTIVARSHSIIRHKLKVYVLDDKRREWLRKYCERRAHPRHAAGEPARQSREYESRPEVSRGDFVAVFDADFVPYRHLRRTLHFC